MFYGVRGYENFFHQSWNVFVPPPDANYKLFVTFENKGVVQHSDVFYEIMVGHQSNRFKGYEPLLMTLSNSISGFEKSTALQAPVNGPVSGNFHFAMIEQVVKGYINNKYAASVQQPKLMLVVEQVGSKNKRIYFN